MTAINVVHSREHLDQILKFFPGGKGAPYGEVTKNVATAQGLALKVKMLGFAVVIFRQTEKDSNTYRVYRSIKKAPPGGLWRDAGRFGIPTKKRKTNMMIARKRISRR